MGDGGTPSSAMCAGGRNLLVKQHVDLNLGMEHLGQICQL